MHPQKLPKYVPEKIQQTAFFNIPINETFPKTKQQMLGFLELLGVVRFFF